jgi:hypothetical protein
MGGTIPGVTGMMYGRTSGLEPLEPNKAQTGRRLKRSSNPETREIIRDNIPTNLLSELPTAETPKQVRHNEIQKKLNTRSEVVPYVPQSLASKTLDVATNPMTALGYIARGQDIPDNFTAGPRNATDYALDVINPAQYALDATNLVAGTVKGDLGQIGEGVLGVLPLGLEAKNISKSFNKLKNKSINEYKYFKELDKFNNKSLYHNYIRGQIPGDIDKLALFKNHYTSLYGEKLANQKIAKEVDNIINSIKPGKQLREKSLSTDSYRLLLHKAGALKDDFKIIPTNSYQELNQLGSLRQDLFEKYSKPLDNFLEESRGLKFGEGQWELIFNDLEKSLHQKTNYDLKNSLQSYTDRLSRQTGQPIKPVKILEDGRILAPQIIMERKGKKLKDELYRHSFPLKLGTVTATTAGTLDIIGESLGIKDSYILNAIEKKEQDENAKMQNGGVIKDDRGQWAHPGKITQIDSNNITMQGVSYPVLGISDTGDTKMMQPGEDYKFEGNNVTEYPMAKNGSSLVELNQLTNFTNYNTPQPGGWLDKYN